MIRPLPSAPHRDLIPQAIVARRFSTVARPFRDFVVRDQDDLDAYEGLALTLDDELTFELRHYSGHTPNTVTIYLEPEVRDVAYIRHLVARIVAELRIPQHAVTWQRGDPLAPPLTSARSA